MLHVHRSADADVLVEGLAALLDTPVGDAFAAEIVAVPAKGVERWLAQRLSHALGAGGGGAGVCANVLFPAPGRLLDEALAAAGPNPAGDGDPWDAQRLVWPLLVVLCDSDDRLARRLTENDRRFTAAARLAGVFARYGRERPRMLTGWAAGQDDTAEDPLPADLSWQPGLWRSLRERVGVPSPAERLPEALARLRAQPELVGLPERFSVYGANRLSRSRLEVLAALAAHRDVHLWLNHASRAQGRCWSRCPATCRLCSGGWRRSHRTCSTTCIRRRRDRTRCSADCRRHWPTTRRRPRPRSWPLTTRASPCTPATVAPGTTRCCVRRCWSASPPTRRCNRATSWSCARTWRSSRR